MANLEKIVDDLSSLTVMEAAELSNLLEEKWGVSAAAPVAVAAAGAGDGAVVEAESDEVDVILASFGKKKINVIKEVRAITALFLKEAKDMRATFSESLPRMGNSLNTIRMLESSLSVFTRVGMAMRQ